MLLVGGTVATTLVLGGCVVLLCARSRPVPWTSVLQTAWIGSALPVLLALQGAGADEAAHVVWFTVPPLFIALVAPLPLPRSQEATDCSAGRPQQNAEVGIGTLGASSLLRRSAVAMALAAAGIFAWTALADWSDAGNPPPNV